MRKLLIALTVCAAVIGCAKPKDRAGHAITVDQSGDTKTVAPTQEETDAREISSIYHLYAREGGLNRTEMANLMARQSGQTPSGAELDLIFRLDANNDKSVTLAEIASGIQENIVLLKWVPRDAHVTREQLASRIAATYPEATAAACEGLAAALMRLDSAWAGGNGNGTLERAESSDAGLVLAYFGHLDISKGMPLPADASVVKRAAVHEADRKLEQQILGRFTADSFAELPLADRKVEWLQFAVRMVLGNRLAAGYGGKIPADKLDEAVKKLSELEAPVVPPAGVLKLFRTGKADEAWSGIELSGLVSDLEYSSKFVALKPAGPESRLARLFPLTGTDLFVISTAPASSGRPAPGPAPAPTLSLRPELAAGIADAPAFISLLGRARLVEIAFLTSDSDHDGKFSRSEAGPLVTALGQDSELLDLLFSDMLIRGEVDLGVPGKPVDLLGPWDLFQRVDKLIDQG